MIEAKNLCKIYKPKKGVPVKALDNVSIRFPQTGMVFLLGKSGSGKSTLLNLLGGLDSYNSGDILIKGESTKSFRQKQFDSYRNTYVGFIFQEYNILDEFTVGANIALAIELQNRKANDDEINDILDKVDLAGYGNRKPNELSGGQKQRVAIARALVKNPEIIMADEPTGALDSATGKQVLDTLKKLSADKLVIIVSHDREFAEKYADRIIELADGKVISDMSLSPESTENAEQSSAGLEFSGSKIIVPARYQLTEADREQINAYIKSLNGDDETEINVSDGKVTSHFIATDEKAIKSDYTQGMQLIKSKLPGKSAFKIGASGLKYKKFRLVMTIFLSCIAFGLFGLSDTFGAYNHIKTCTNSIVDTGVKSAAVEKSKKTYYDYWSSNGFTLSKEEIDDFSKKTGVEMRGVYAPDFYNFSYGSMLAPTDEGNEPQYQIYQSDLSGFSEINQDILEKEGLKLLAGKLPDGNRDEVAVSEYVYEVFKKFGTLDANGKKVTVKAYSDIIGKTLEISDKKLTITGIIDTGFDISRYKSFETEEKRNYSNAENIIRYALYNEFCTTSAYSYAKILMVGDGYIDRLIASAPSVYPIVSGYITYNSDEVYVDSRNMTTLSRIPKQEIKWVDGEKNVLAENEIIVSSDLVEYLNQTETKSNTEEYAGTEENVQDDIASQLEKIKKVKNLTKSATLMYTDDESKQDITEENQKIVGIIPITESNRGYSSTIIVSEDIFNTFCLDGTAPYRFAVGKMPDNREGIEKLVEACYAENNGTRLPLQNSVTYELDSVNSILKELSKIFLYIGIGFACFAALMLANFIATSISHKKQEIGILRAIGSRSNDVFRIFFSESMIIAAINFVLSAIGVFVATMIINQFIRNNVGVLITVLSFGPRQILLLIAVSALVAAIASYLPVKKIASKRPIDAIRDK